MRAATRRVLRQKLRRKALSPPPLLRQNDAFANVMKLIWWVILALARHRYELAANSLPLSPCGRGCPSGGEAERGRERGRCLRRVRGPPPPPPRPPRPPPPPPPPHRPKVPPAAPSEAVSFATCPQAFVPPAFRSYTYAEPWNDSSPSAPTSATSPATLTE